MGCGVELGGSQMCIRDSYKGRVTRLMNFGAFVEIAPGKEGLVHIDVYKRQITCSAMFYSFISYRFCALKMQQSCIMRIFSPYDIYITTALAVNACLLYTSRCV